MVWDILQHMYYAVLRRYSRTREAAFSRAQREGSAIGEGAMQRFARIQREAGLESVLRFLGE